MGVSPRVVYLHRSVYTACLSILLQLDRKELLLPFRSLVHFFYISKFEQYACRNIYIYVHLDDENEY